MRLALALSLAFASTALAGCGDDADPGLGPIVCDLPATPPASTDPCAGRVCFEACGVPIAVEVPIAASGLDTLAAPEIRPHAARRIGTPVATAVPTGVQLRQGNEAGVVGALALSGTPTTLADAGGQLFAATAANTLHAIDTSDPTRPIAIATWRPTAPVELVPTRNDRLILRTPSGVSVLDVTDPTAPSEVACFVVPATGGMDRVWDVAASRYFVVAAGGDTPRAFVYDLQRPTQPPSPLPIDDQTSVTLDDAAVLVTSGGQGVHYALVPGQPVAELRRVALPSAVFRPPVTGGFVLYGDVALDLTDDLALYDVIDTGGPSCTLSLNARDLSGAWVIAPTVAPDRRYGVDDFPTFDCGPRHVRFPGARAGAHEPDGPRLLLVHDGGVSLVDGETGARIDGLAIAGAPAWVADHLVGVAATGDATGEALGVALTWVDASAPTAAAGGVTLDRPWVAWASDTNHLWLVLEPAPRVVGAEPPPASGAALARVTPPSADAVEVALADGVAPIGLVASADRVWVFDDKRRIHPLDAAGAALFTVDAERDADPISAIASALGVFFVDGCGAATWVAPDGTLRVSAGPTPQWLGAGADAVWAVANDAPHPGLAGGPLLVALAPTPDGADGFTFTRVASAPLPLGPAAVIPGDPLGVALGGLFLFERR